MNPNLTEILVANGTGAALAFMLCLSRLKYHKTKNIGAKLFDIMLYVTLLANIAEAVSFLLDGKSFPFCRGLLLVVNGFCVAAAVIVGYCFCLYTDFRIHRNRQYMKKTALALAVPLLVILLLLLADLFGAGLLYAITSENLYVRGPFYLLAFLSLFAYYTYSVAVTYRSWKEYPHVKFFPVLYFIIPCVVGTVVQSMFYGITLGWMAVAIAFVFVQLNFQGENAFMDELSGLYNRNYFNHIFNVFPRKHYDNVYGIMMDVDGFKKINDTFGHVTGDDALRTIAAILLKSAPDSSVTIRMGGDEFIVLLPGSSREETDAVIRQIRSYVDALNESGEKCYTLSLSIGSARYNGGSTDRFLSDMDQGLYQAKEAYYRSESES